MKVTGTSVRRRMGWSAGLFLAMAVFLPGLARAQETKDSPVMTALKSLKLSGYAQVYGAVWDKDTDTFSLHRARVSLSGELVKNLRFKVQVDLVKSPVLLDGLVEFEPFKAAGLRFGQFKVPFSIENLVSSGDLDLINRSLVVDTLCPGRDNGSSGRDIGVVAYGTYSVLEYTAGLFNGSGINNVEVDVRKK